MAIKNSKGVEILGITLDRHMNFLIEKLRINPLYKSMMKSHSNCCQLVWMFCSRQSNNSINKVHERGPKLTYRAEIKDFQQIRREQNEITIHQRNLQVLMTEVYKIVTSIVTSVMNSLFQFRCNTNLQKIAKPSNKGGKQ